MESKQITTVYIYYKRWRDNKEEPKVILYQFSSIYRCLIKNQTAIVHIKLDERACLELFSNYKSLGRVTLRSHMSTIAAGIIIELG